MPPGLLGLVLHSILARADVVTVTAAPSIPSTSPQFVDTELFTSAILNSTNFFRADHNATPAEWNSTIADFAADYLRGNDDCDFKHSGGPYGENIALGCTEVTGCVDLWGNERKDYNKPEFSEETGHFTQLVWKNSTNVGCGRRLCGDKGWFLVCEYWPRGNVVGQFGDQVGRRVSRGPHVAPSLAAVGWMLLAAFSAVS
jgi:hypothetical protein